MKVLSVWWAKFRGQAPATDQISCDIDACDYGQRHQMIHVQLVSFLPALIKRLEREVSVTLTYYAELDAVSTTMPAKFLRLAHNAEAEEIICEYLYKYYSYQVKNCRLNRMSDRRLRLTVWFEPALTISTAY